MIKNLFSNLKDTLLPISSAHCDSEPRLIMNSELPLIVARDDHHHEDGDDNDYDDDNDYADEFLQTIALIIPLALSRLKWLLTKTEVNLNNVFCRPPLQYCDPQE